jgi:hypothetical protein
MYLSVTDPEIAQSIFDDNSDYGKSDMSVVFMDIYRSQENFETYLQTGSSVDAPHFGGTEVWGETYEEAMQKAQYMITAVNNFSANYGPLVVV